jgi:hypothetical protein
MLGGQGTIHAIRVICGENRRKTPKERERWGDVEEMGRSEGVELLTVDSKFNGLICRSQPATCYILIFAWAAPKKNHAGSSMLV